MTGSELAKQVGISQSKLSKIETGTLVPSTEDLRRLLSVLSPSKADAKRLFEWASLLRSEYVSWRVEHRKGFAASQIEAGEIERRSTRIRLFQMALIPGLLQIPAYARQVIELSNTSQQQDLDRALALRIRRQELLYEPSRSFEFLITESAALSRFCDSQVVIQQLDRLSAMTGLPNVRIGFVPTSACYPRIPLTSFCIFDAKSVVVEMHSGQFSTIDEGAIASYEDFFGAFSTVALYGPQANELLASWKNALQSLPDGVCSVA